MNDEDDEAINLNVTCLLKNIEIGSYLHIYLAFEIESKLCLHRLQFKAVSMHH